jgi:hypothetical protein
MSSRADRLLEGFKLGSLGVSKKPKVTITPDDNTTPEESETSQILKQGFAAPKTIANTSDKLCPWILWKDTDGLRYVLRVTAPLGGKGKFKIQFCAGPNLDYDESKACVTLNTVVFAAEKKDFKDYDQIIDLFDAYVHIISRKGINGLVEHIFKVFGPYPESQKKFESWLISKKSELGIK